MEKVLPKKSYVVGYGSLVNIDSAKTTIKGGFKYHFNTIKGWKRSFTCYGGLNTPYNYKYASTTQPDGIEYVPAFSHTYLNMVASPDTSSTVIVLELNATQLKDVINREKNYVKLDVTTQMGSIYDAPVYMFVADLANSIPEVLYPSKIASYYWDTCEIAHKKANLLTEFEEQCNPFKKNIIEVQLNPHMERY